MQVQSRVREGVPTPRSSPSCTPDTHTHTIIVLLLDVEILVNLAEYAEVIKLVDLIEL